MAITLPTSAVHWPFISHTLLLCWMLAASFIDIDEKIIPDEITVTGTLLGLLLATIAPMSLLPQVVERDAGADVLGSPAVKLGAAEWRAGCRCGRRRVCGWNR